MGVTAEATTSPFAAPRAACEQKFCPDAGLLSAAGMEASATGMILQPLLRPFALLATTGSAAFLIRELLVRSSSPLWLCYMTLAVMVGLTIHLFVTRGMELPQLRRIELGMFAALAVQSVVTGYDRVVLAAATGDAGLVISRFYASSTVFLLVMAAYAIIIPNSWRRSLVVIAPLTLAPGLLWGLCAAFQPDVLELAAQAGPRYVIEATTDIALVSLLAASLCVMGVVLITRYRANAFEARTANLYDLRERIGAGGMGEVWLAEHQTLLRPAAIKIVRPELLAGDAPTSAETALKRFTREAQSTAALRSPNTVEIYDYGVTQEGVFYYVMEYLDGLDLGTLVKKHGALPPARAIYLLRQACSSLEEAHQRGLVHRDIKPANVFACRMGTEHDFVKVLDFGLVKTQRSTELTQLTMDGLTTGTPAYMAPEMALQKGTVGPATDVYALGCVAYWLLTGKLVFENASPVAMIVSHVKDAPAPPSTRTELPIPAGLDEIVLRCLAKDPGDRFPSMRALSDALADVPRDDSWGRRRAEEWWGLHQPTNNVHEFARAS